MGNDTNRGAAEENSQLLDEPRRTGRNPHLRGQLRHVPQNQPEFRSSRMLPRFTCALPFLSVFTLGCIKPLSCVELLQCAPPGASVHGDAAMPPSVTADEDAALSASGAPNPDDLASAEAGSSYEASVQATNASSVESETRIELETRVTSSTWSNETTSDDSTCCAADARADDAGDAATAAPVGVCGDGLWEPRAEACEDGDTQSFDGCSSECQQEPYGVTLDRACPSINPGSLTCGTDAGTFHLCYGQETSVREVAARACTKCFGSCSDVAEVLCGGAALAFAHRPALPACQVYFVYDGSGSCVGRQGAIDMRPGSVMTDCAAAGGIGSKGDLL